MAKQYTVVVYDNVFSMEGIARRTSPTLAKAKILAKAMYAEHRGYPDRAVWVFAGSEHMLSPIVFEITP
jgi:hypothetical protein